MKFNPLTKEIYTEEGVFVKTMKCPYKMSWENLEASNSNMRKCAACDHLIVDTEFFTDDELLKMVRQNHATCLKIDLNQHNIKIVTNGVLGRK